MIERRANPHGLSWDLIPEWAIVVCETAGFVALIACCAGIFMGVSKLLGAT